jgi:hypothetical protein
MEMETTLVNKLQLLLHPLMDHLQMEMDIHQHLDQMEIMAMQLQLNPLRNTDLQAMGMAMDIPVRNIKVINKLLFLTIDFDTVATRSEISSFGGSGSVEATNSIYAQGGGYSSGGPSAVPETIQQSYDANGGYQY